MELLRIRKRIFGESVRKALPRSECAICTDSFQTGEELSQLSCGHFFHCRCLYPWLERARTCPTCRRALPGGPPPQVNSATPRARLLMVERGEAIDLDRLVAQGREWVQRCVNGSASRHKPSARTPPRAVRRFGGGTLCLQNNNPSPSHPTGAPMAWTSRRTPLPATRPQTQHASTRSVQHASPINLTQMQLAQRQARPRTTPNPNRNVTRPGTTPNCCRLPVPSATGGLNPLKRVVSKIARRARAHPSAPGHTESESSSVHP